MEMLNGILGEMKRVKDLANDGYSDRTKEILAESKEIIKRAESIIGESDAKRYEEIRNSRIEEYKNADKVTGYTRTRFNDVKDLGIGQTYESVLISGCNNLIFANSPYFKNNFFGLDEEDGKYCYFKLVNIESTKEHTKRYSPEYCMATEDDTHALITALYSCHISSVKLVFQVFDGASDPKTITLEDKVDFESFEWNKLEEAFKKMPERSKQFKLRVR